MKYLTVIIVFFICISLYATQPERNVLSSYNNRCNSINTDIQSKDTGKQKIKITMEVQNLSSTHGTNFNGADLIVSYPLSPSFFVGLGTEYSHTGYHFDNGWNLTNLKFIPVFIDSKLNLTKNTILTPFVHLSSGISFASYTMEDISALGKFYPVSEKGLYLYSGIGLSLKSSKYFATFIDLGFKGYHMSLNALDVNPHGLTLRLGLEF
jgi:hypothetical protein